MAGCAMVAQNTRTCPVKRADRSSLYVRRRCEGYLGVFRRMLLEESGQVRSTAGGGRVPHTHILVPAAIHRNPAGIT